jgi:hypothetical protein
VPGKGMRAMTALLATAALALSVGAAAGGPRLEVRPQKLDFGSMKRGEKLRKVLYVRNAGDRPLVIDQIRPSCTECIVDQPPLRPLSPGQEMELPITFLASDLPGDHTAYVTFQTNDPVEPLKRVYLSVTIEPTKLPRLSLSSEALDLGVVLAGEPALCSAELANAGDAPLLVKDLTAAPGVERLGELPTQIAPGARYELKLRLRPEAAGPLKGYVTLMTDDPERPVLTVPIGGYAATQEQVERLVHGVLVAPLDGAARVTNSAGAPVRVSVNPSPVRTTLAPGQSVVLRQPVGEPLIVSLELPSERSR